MHTVNELLRFAQAHSWGREARYEGGRICGLINAYTVRNANGDVDYFEEAASVPATLRDLRNFGGY